MSRALSALVATCCALAAQKVAMIDGSERHVAVVNVTDLVQPAASAPGAAEDRFAAARTPRLPEVLRFVRAFTPVITGPGADLQTLGDRHLVALGMPEQVAAVDRVVLRAREHKETEFHVDLRVVTVPAAVFDRELANTLKAPPAAAPDGERAPRVALLADERSRRLWKMLHDTRQVQGVQCPNLTTPSLVLALIRVGKERRVRDFDVATIDSMPVHDTVFDGFEAKVLCAEIGNDTIGVLLDLVDRKVEQPIAEHATTLPGTTRPATVQTLRVTGCRGSQTVEMKSGETTLMAVRKPDGRWVVSFLTVLALPPPQPALWRR